VQQLRQSQSQQALSPKQTVLNNNKTVSKYISGVAVTSKNTAKAYLKRLTNFQGFVSQKYDLTLDELITTLTVKGRGPKIKFPFSATSRQASQANLFTAAHSNVLQV
jgi:hypothetical protein